MKICTKHGGIVYKLFRPHLFFSYFCYGCMRERKESEIIESAKLGLKAELEKYGITNNL